MSKVAVVYWSGSGNTAAMAQAVMDGITAAGGSGDYYMPDSFSAAMVDQYDAIAFGCPAMGDEVLEEGEFQPMFDECIGKLSGKKIGLFGSYGWGVGDWMTNWEADCLSAGAVMPGGTVIAHEAPDAEAVAACNALGSALAK